MSEVNSFKLVDILKNLLENNTVLTISKKLNVATGTVKRWIELDNIPPHYTFDLLKLANIEIDYTKYSYKEKDQFFTPNDTALLTNTVMIQLNMTLLNLLRVMVHFLSYFL